MSLNAQRFKQNLSFSALRYTSRVISVENEILEYETGELFVSRDDLSSDAVSEGGFQDSVEASSPIRWGEGTETLVEAAQRWAKEQAELARRQEIYRKWMNREYKWQEMLAFVQAKYGIPISDLTPAEWESKKITKERAQNLGVRSPKLSKVLMAFGIPKEEVSLLLGANYNKESQQKKAATQIFSDRTSAYDQGNSIHYTSCQATDPRAAWEGGNEHQKVQEEAPYIGISWFMWVVGQPMSQDGEGFEVRAKLRLMYTENEKLAGLYIDRPYGKFMMLLDNFEELQEWWSDWLEKNGFPTNLPILMPPVWDRSNGAGSDFQADYGGRYSEKLFCPSAEYGYQDTLQRGKGPYDFFVKVSEAGSLLTKAYSNRTKIGGVYYSSLSEVTYNPQNDEIKAPAIQLPIYRGQLSEKYRELSKQSHLLFGADSFEQVGSRYYFWKEGCRIELNNRGSKIVALKCAESHRTFLVLRNSDMEVREEYPELGFYPAQLIPFRPQKSPKGGSIIGTRVMSELPYQEIEGEVYGGFYPPEEITHISRVNKEATQICPPETGKNYRIWVENALVVHTNEVEGFSPSIPLPLQRAGRGVWSRVILPPKLEETLKEYGWMPAIPDLTVGPIVKGHNGPRIGFQVRRSRPEYGFELAVPVNSWAKRRTFHGLVGTVVTVTGGGFAPAEPIR